MDKQARKLEILAPAGSTEQLISAVNNGCDAVYLGLDSFNARMKAPNFTLENLRAHVRYCHLFGVKVFVAINTSVKNTEFAQAAQLLLDAYKLNVDGVIITDLALMKLAATLPKPFEVVASTQLNVHDRSGAQFVKNAGATTVVCARECDLDNIRDIASVGIKVECFLHGALCVCQSGQCLFSSMVGGNSGNRGLCAQPCRKKYTSNADGYGGYLLSARDICGITTAKLLADAGATTFKIEGRNRRAEYAGITSRAYRKAFDNDFEFDVKDVHNLKEMYNRGMSDNNYLLGKNDDIIYYKLQSHSGVFVGTVKGGGVNSTVCLNKGDGLKILYDGVEVCGGVALETGNGYIRAAFDGKIADGMEAYRTTSVTLLNDISSVKRKLNVRLLFSATAGQKAVITAKFQNIKVKVESSFVVESAVNKPTNEEEIAQQLRKTGETHYTISDIDIVLGKIFIAKSQVNALRREVLDCLTESIIANYEKTFADRISVDLPLPNISAVSKEHACAVVCYSERELKDSAKDAEYLIYKPEIIDAAAMKIACAHGAYLDIPPSASDMYLTRLLDSGKVGLVCHNVSHAQLAKKFALNYIAGSGLNIFNDYIASFFDDADTFVYSMELSLKEISAFRNKTGLIFVDGGITLMKMLHCPYKSIYRCDCADCKANNELIYRDELGNEFNIRRRRDGKCSFELINGKKLSAAAKIFHAGRYLFDYDKSVLAHYAALNNGVCDGYTEKSPYTKGRLFSKIR